MSSEFLARDMKGSITCGDTFSVAALSTVSSM